MNELEQKNNIDIPPEPKSQKAKNTRKKILDAARKIFAEKGFGRATAEEIATQAEVGYGTFYLYFKDKRQALHTIISEVDEELYEPNLRIENYRKGLGALSIIKATLSSFFDSFEKYSDIIKICHELSATDPEFKEKHDEVRARLTTRMKDHLVKGLEAGTVRNVDSEIASVALAGLIETIAIEWFFNKRNWNREKVIETVSKLYLGAVVKSR